MTFWKVFYIWVSDIFFYLNGMFCLLKYQVCSVNIACGRVGGGLGGSATSLRCSTFLLLTPSSSPDGRFSLGCISHIHRKRLLKGGNTGLSRPSIAFKPTNRITSLLVLVKSPHLKASCWCEGDISGTSLGGGDHIATVFGLILVNVSREWSQNIFSIFSIFCYSFC